MTKEQRIRLGASVGMDVEGYLRREGENTTKTFTMLARLGWYPDLDWWSGQAWLVAKELSSDSPEAANESMCMYVDHKLAEFELKLRTQYATRSRFIEDAFGAHRAAKYTLSIPVLLAQADGICFDVLGEQLYSAPGGKLKVAERLRKLPYVADYGGGAYAPLLDTFPIVWTAKERAAAGKDVFNRHAIMHGESIDYDTRRRSSQAVMFLNYVGVMMRLAGDRKRDSDG